MWIQIRIEEMWMQNYTYLVEGRMKRRIARVEQRIPKDKLSRRADTDKIAKVEVRMQRRKA